MGQETGEFAVWAPRDIAAPFVYRNAIVSRRRLREGSHRNAPHANEEAQMTVKPLYRRVLLKASGEALM
ncbi:hypothetical protein EN950_37265, partial [Mesorhizobium sp. M7A.F.Ca.US.007.01.1.1]